MAAKKRKQIHHNYDPQHKTFILAALANGKTYAKIIELFEKEFTWATNDAMIRRIKTQGLVKVSNPGKDYVTPLTAMSNTTKHEVSRAMNTNEIRENFVNRILPLINMDVMEDGTPLTAIDKIALIKELSQPLLNTLSGIDNASKLTQHLSQTNIYMADATEASDDELQGSFKRFQAVFCPRCPAMLQFKKTEVIDI